MQLLLKSISPVMPLVDTLWRIASFRSSLALRRRVRRMLSEILESRQLMASSPIGWVDQVSPAGMVNGWAADMDNPVQSIEVHMYVI